MISNCDCCDRRHVPGSVVDCPGEPFACFICQGDPDPDPYFELEDYTPPPAPPIERAIHSQPN